MKLKAYTIYDVVAEEYGYPYGSKNNGTAQRQFHDFINQTKADPTEYALFCIGEFDSENGSMEVYGTPQKVYAPAEMIPQKD